MYRRIAGLLCAGIALVSTPSTAQDVRHRAMEPQEATIQAKAFEESLVALGIPTRLDCSSVIEVFADSNAEQRSFGALCSVQIGDKAAADMMICDDAMIGTLTLKAYGFSQTVDELASFTAANCQG
ncbi:hypothetical protein GCM10007913_22590 [Devosia yakushimensis]|uniref:UrcA family protein n=1 Tax=Devosia yakushimensis TaxID=470028 RepID=A0ABQ5UE23_9HYPH|nr:hypothetical protein [Devosia yakushimensis]GLQ10327.1 hypothetical protein GCM10007913_22590 [Devosia yakushimensis]